MIWVFVLRVMLTEREYFMQSRLLLIVLIFTTPDIYALKLQTQEQPVNESDPALEQKADKPVRKPAGTPTTTFTPSEKIQADSAVSFPVDI